jgi:hypothetical protein
MLDTYQVPVVSGFFNIKPDSTILTPRFAEVSIARRLAMGGPADSGFIRPAAPSPNAAAAIG